MESARSSPDLGNQLTTLYSLGAAGSLTDGQLLDRFLARMDPAASDTAFTAMVDRHGIPGTPYGFRGQIPGTS